MTTSITTNITGPTAGDGANETFNYNFRIDDEDDLVVIHTDAAGAETTLAITVDYTVSGGGDEAGGTISTTAWSSSPIPSTETLTLKRVLPLTQLTNLRNQGGYFPEVQEAVFDSLVFRLQQLQEQLDRAVKSMPTAQTFDPILPSSLTAGYVLAINDTANGLTAVQGVPVGSLSVSSFAETLLDDASAVVARATLGIDGSSGNIASGDLAALAVIAAKIATDAVETAKIKDLNVTTAKLAANAVTAAKLATAVNPLGKQTVWIPAGGMVSRTTSGAQAVTTELTTNKVMVESYDFDTSSDEFVQFNLRFPKGYDGGAVNVAYTWTAAAGSGAVAWAIQAVALSDDNAIDTAFGTAVVTSDTLLAVNDIHVTATSGDITIAGSPGEGDWVSFQTYRDVSADNIGNDVKLIGVTLFFTIDSANDD